MDAGVGRKKNIYIVALGGQSNPILWAAVPVFQGMRRNGCENLYKVGKLRSNSIFLFPFCPSVRKLTYFHACSTDEGCAFSQKDSIIRLSTAPLAGRQIYILV